MHKISPNDYLKVMTHLEILLKSAKGMLEQNAKSISATSGIDNDCEYFENGLPDGKKCGVGFLIDPKHYTPRIEGAGVFDDLPKSVLSLSGIDTENVITIEILKDIQNIHDFTQVSSWKLKFLELAEKHLYQEEFQTFCDEIAEY